ncbi:MAG: O-methyltransferase [Calditrichaeota bacterium]|nr:O-methyltransferase [Calditrichota bacterium]
MKPEELWQAVDSYLVEKFVAHDAALEDALRRQQHSELPQIQVSPLEGQLLHILLRAMNAKRVLEIGTLGGYSAILLARALPDDGKVITLEVDAKHAEVAKQAFALAKLEDKIELRLGAALDTLPELKKEGHVFDFVFIDADKENNVHYVQWALKMSRPGTLIVVDNVVRGGDVIKSDSTSPMTLGVRKMNDYLSKEPRLLTTVLQTVGSKEHDGMAFILVKE